jgi:hypothetical protein
MTYKDTWEEYITKGTNPSNDGLESLAKVLLQAPGEEMREFVLERIRNCPNKDKPMKLSSGKLAAKLIFLGTNEYRINDSVGLNCSILAARFRKLKDEAAKKLCKTLEEADAKRYVKCDASYTDLFEEMIKSHKYTGEKHDDMVFDYLNQVWTNEDLDAMASKFMEVPVEEYRKFAHESAVKRPECRKLMTDMVTRGARNPGSKCEEFLNNCRAEKERLRQEQIALRPEKFKVPAFDVKACLKEIKEEV